jgi:hypothetical protein
MGMLSLGGFGRWHLVLGFGYWLFCFRTC